MKRKIAYLTDCTRDLKSLIMIRGTVKLIDLLEDSEPLTEEQTTFLNTLPEESLEQQEIIDNLLKDCDTALFLIGEETHKKPWISYAIKKAFLKNLTLLGINLHPLEQKEENYTNPLENLTLEGRELKNLIRTFTPDREYPLDDIQHNLSSWIKKSTPL